MTVLIIFNIFAMFVAIFIGNFVFQKNPKNKLNQTFLLITILDAGFIYLEHLFFTAQSAQECIFYYRLSFFWPFALVLILHFTLLFTDYVKKIKPSLYYPVLFLPPLAIGIEELFLPLTSDNFIHTKWGWMAQFQDLRIIDILVAAWTLIVLILPIIIVLNYLNKIRSIQRKRQTFFIIIGLIIPAIYTMISSLIIPVLNVTIIPIDSIIYIFSTVLLGYGIWRFEIFVLTPARVANKILHTIPDMVFLIDTTGFIRIINTAVLNTLGFRKDELIGNQLCDIIEHDHDSNEYFPFSKELRHNDQLIDVETVIFTKNGTKIDVSISATQEKDDKGNLLALIYVCRNINDRKVREKESLKLHQDLIKANENLQQILKSERSLRDKLIHSEKFASLGQIGAKIAHELNNPLTVINGEAQLRLRMDLPEDLRKSYLSILEESERIKSISAAYIDLSKPTVLKIESLDINDLIIDCLDKMLLTGETKRIKLITKLNPQIPRINGDSSRLIQALRNIIINAVHALKSCQNPTIKVMSDFDESKENICIKIHDNGCGIENIHIGKIFNLYYTTRHDANGTGLGLVVVKEIIENQHNGEIRVQSVVGEETTFTIILPLTSVSN